MQLMQALKWIWILIVMKASLIIQSDRPKKMTKTRAKRARNDDEEEEEEGVLIARVMKMEARVVHPLQCTNAHASMRVVHPAVRVLVRLL